VSAVSSGRFARDPHVALALAAAIVLAAEYGYQRWTSDAWLLAQALAAFLALAQAWREQARLRLVPILILAACFQAAFVGLHLTLDVAGDIDSRIVYRRQGNALLDGDYPRSEYPLGAVLLFAFEAWLGGGATRAVNAWLMIPCQLSIVAGVWALRPRFSGWIAALIAFWPMSTHYWEFKFDLVPAALLVVGLLLAVRERWALSGVVLGLGAVVKWTPGLSFLALLVWLLASGRSRLALRHGAAFVATAFLLHLPFLLWSPSDVLAAYTRQGGRAITAESIWFLPLDALGLARVDRHISFSAHAPGWANGAAIVLQGLAVLFLLVVAARTGGNLGAGIAVAALVPVVFLLTNRIFSPQFILVIVAGLAVAAALLVRSRAEQAVFGLAVMTATLANAFVYPFALPYYTVTWKLASLTLFAVSLAASAWLVRRALDEAASPHPAFVAEAAPEA
jgi:Glycosyltransferase family 87